MAGFVQFHCLYMGYVWFVLSKFVVDVVLYPALFSCLAGFFLISISALPHDHWQGLISALAGWIGCSIPHKTHLKAYFSAIRCTGRVNVQGQSIGTKKGTQSPHFLELAGSTPIVLPLRQLCPYRWCF